METQPTKIKIKAKYLVRFTPKFAGKKRSSGNSGKVGRTARSAKRSLGPTSRKPGRFHQYDMWVAAGRPGI